MDASPVLRCGNWDELIAAVAARPGFAVLAGIEPALARAVLAAPAAIATWVARRMPHVAGRGRPRVLVIGAETVDAVDQGRWYAALPALLGSECEAAVTLVGAELDPSFTSAAGALAPGKPARCVRSHLAEFLADEGGAAFDLAGRSTDSWDPMDRQTTTAYTIANGLLTQRDVTNALSHKGATTLERTRS